MSLVRFRVRAPYSEEPAYGGFFAFWGTDSPSNCVRLFGLKASPCGPALKRCSTRRQRRLSESGRPIQKNPPMAGSSLSGVRTLHRTAFDYSAKGLTLRASAKALFNAAPAPVVRVRSPYSEEPAYGGFFAFWGTDSPSNCVRLFGLKASPCGPALKRCSTRRQRRLSESGRPIQKNPPMAGFRFLGYGLSIELRSIICQARHALSDSDRGRLQPGNHQWQKGCCAAYQPGLVSGGKHSG